MGDKSQFEPIPAQSPKVEQVGIFDYQARIAVWFRLPDGRLERLEITAAKLWEAMKC